MRVLLAASTLALALVAGAAQAQSAGLYGQVSLTSGFEDDPYGVNVQAGGAENLSDTFGDDCHGWVTLEPSFMLHYQASDEWPLDIYTTGDVDTVVLVRAPDGSFWCDDDSGWEGEDWVNIETPASGEYAIWVGTFEQGASGAAQIFISETYAEEAFFDLDW